LTIENGGITQTKTGVGDNQFPASVKYRSIRR
jgi:hypothetical protein